MRRLAAAFLVALLGCASPARGPKPGGDGVSESNLRATVEKLVSFGTRNSLSTRGIGEASAWLKAEFEKIPGLKVEFHEFTDEKLKRDGQLVTQRNVIATLRGTARPDEVVVFGAHYDSLNLKERGNFDAFAPGANDNATGTAGVLEAARILSATSHDRTLIFACFSAEEQGLIGAWHFAKHLKDTGVNVVCMLNNDIIGGAKDDDGKPLNHAALRCFSAPPQESDSRRLARLAKLVVERRMPDFTVHVQDAVDRPRRAGDHKSFNAHGFTAIRFIEGVETDKVHHTPDDVIERIHFPYHARVVAADIALLRNLASAPPAPAPPEVKGVGSKLQVSWTPVEGADGYLVGVRRGETDFIRYIDTDTREVTLEVAGPVSVCVAAIDARGNISFFSPESNP
jgi:hypothetical protein